MGQKCMFVVRFWWFNRITYREPCKEIGGGTGFEGMPDFRLVRCNGFFVRCPSLRFSWSLEVVLRFA